MDFLSYDHSFCEALLYGGPPEYINAFTSLYISFVGLYGIKNNYHSINDIFLLYSALLINGIASFAYHWTNYLGFGIFDRCSMILIAYPSINAGIKEFVYMYKINDKNKKILLFLNQLYFTCLISFCALGYEETFNGLFGIFLGLILIFMILINRKKNQYIEYNIDKYMICGFIGVAMIITAGISWILIEKFCHSYSIMKYLQGHALWHIFVSSGGYLSSLILTSLSLKRKNILPVHNLHIFSISYNKID